MTADDKDQKKPENGAQPEPGQPEQGQPDNGQPEPGQPEPGQDASPSSAESVSGADIETGAEPGADDQKAESDAKADDAAESLHPAGMERILELFGGVRPMAARLGLAVGTVQSWKKAGRIPGEFHDAVINASDSQGLGITRGDLAPGFGKSHIPVAAAPKDPFVDDAAAGAAPSSGGSAASDEETPPAGGDPDGGTQAVRTVVLRKGGGFSLFVSFIALLAGGAALTEAYWMPHARPYIPANLLPPPAVVAPAPVDPEVLVSGLGDRLGRLEEEVKNDIRLASLNEKVAALEERLGEIATGAREPESTAPAASILAETVAPLRERLESLEARLSGLQEAVDAAAEQAEQAAPSPALAEETAPAPDAEMLTALRDSLEEQQEALAALKAGLEDTDARLASLQQAEDSGNPAPAAEKPAAATEAAPAASGAGTAKLRERIAALEELVASLSENDPANLEKRLASRLARGLERLDDRIGGLEETTERAAARDEAMNRELEGLAKSSAFADKQVVAGLVSRSNALKQEVDTLAGTVKALSGTVEKSAASESVTRELEALKQRQDQIAKVVTAIQQAPKSRLTDAGALLLALGQLRDRLLTSTPYRDELELVRQVLPGDSAERESLAVLNGAADQGLVSLSDLRMSFSTRAREALAESARTGEGDMLDRSLARLNELVTVRKVGDDTPTESLDGQLWRIEKLVQEGSLSRAVEALDQVMTSWPATQKSLQPWLDQAKQRVEAEKTVDNLTRYAITLARKP